MPERDVHEGLADLDRELDVGALAADLATGTPRPLREAAAKLRGEAADDDFSGFELADEPPTGDAPGADDEGGDAGDEAIEEEDEQQQEDQQAEKEEAGEAEAEGEEAEGEEGKEEEKPETSKAKGFTLEIPPLAPGTGRGRERQSIVLEGLPQEFHDLIKGHLGRSQRLGVVEQHLAAAQEFQVAAEFVDQQPLAAMLMLDQNDARLAQPSKIGEKFVALWLRQHPDVAITLVEKLGYHNPSALDPDVLRERAESSRDRADLAVRKGLETQRGRTTSSQWANQMSLMLDDLATTMDLSAGDKEDFMELSVAQIRQRSNDVKRRGGNPLLTRADVLQTIKRTVQRFSPNGGAARPGTRGTRTPEEKFDRRHRVAERTRRTAGGETALAPVTIQAKKFQGVKSVKEAATRLRKG